MSVLSTCEAQALHGEFVPDIPDARLAPVVSIWRTLRVAKVLGTPKAGGEFSQNEVEVGRQEGILTTDYTDSTDILEETETGFLSVISV